MKRGAPVVRKFLKVQEVAMLLSVSRATVYRLVDEGRLERVWVGTSIRVPETSLDGFLREGLRSLLRS
jgi:excisionase family DNA binding protein